MDYREEVKLMKFVELLESKWGAFELDGHAMVNGSMPFVSDVARLNMLFPMHDADAFASFVHEKYQCRLPDQLLDFYQEYNGCRLFFGSLNVFGIQNYPSEVYQPYDLFVENDHILGSMKKRSKTSCDLFFFASIGGDYAFGIEKENPGKITGIKKGSTCSPVQVFADFNSFFDFHFDRLINEYGTDCRKIHPSKQFIGTPALENLSIDIQ